MRRFRMSTAWVGESFTVDTPVVHRESIVFSHLDCGVCSATSVLADRRRWVVKLNRSGVVAVVSCLALLVSSCGNSNSATTADTNLPVDCGGKKELTASGATAQANQMELFVADFEKAC